jgi:hypothetical protein
MVALVLQFQLWNFQASPNSMLFSQSKVVTSTLNLPLVCSRGDMALSCRTRSVFFIYVHICLIYIVYICLLCLYVTYMRREHHTVVSDASPRLFVLAESICLFSEILYGSKVEPSRTNVDKHALIVELWDYL